MTASLREAELAEERAESALGPHVRGAPDEGEVVFEVATVELDGDGESKELNNRITGLGDAAKKQGKRERGERARGVGLRREAARREESLDNEAEENRTRSNSDGCARSDRR